MARSQLVKLVLATAALYGLLALWTASPARAASDPPAGSAPLVQAE
jgi:hypothetical protein